MFIGSLVLHFMENRGRSFSGALLAPLLSLMLFRFGRRVFLRYFKHEIRDTAHDWRPGMAEDRLFNIIYGTFSMMLAILMAIGMNELTKFGW